MSLFNKLITALIQKGMKWNGHCSSSVQKRVERLERVSGLYSRFLLRHPEYLPWLEKEENKSPFGEKMLKKIWEQAFDLKSAPTTEEQLAMLQHFRRQISLHITYCDVNRLCSLVETLKELTVLAEFCLQKVIDLVYVRWEERWGTPWNARTKQPTQYCVFGLGKMGGSELNFCSDIDLIYCYDSDGYCYKEGREMAHTNEAFFTQLVRDSVAMLEARSEYGFLYNVDLRLRPEGSSGPLARSLASMESYYYSVGQTWERLAMIKARVVAGSHELAEYFFESMNSFRYPRHPTPSVMNEIAGVKVRIEKEQLGPEMLERNIKIGPGGIREIEFFIQGLQLLNAGKNPFLQTTSLLQATEKLFLYSLISKEDKALIEEAYPFLRRLENHLQMREEQQTHALPPHGEIYDQLAYLLDFESTDDFNLYLSQLRKRVRSLYDSLFKENHDEQDMQDWMTLLAGDKPSIALQKRLQAWFGSDIDGVQETLCKLVKGGLNNLLTREQVTVFRDIAVQFDTVLPLLAQRRVTLDRFTRFTENYGARMALLKICSGNPVLFRTLCLLFDQSRFIHELLCHYPEIMEEVLFSPLGKMKNIIKRKQEIAHLPQGENFSHWLWLYVKAEQMRISALEMIHSLDFEIAEKELSQTADATIESVLDNVDPEQTIVVIALGKYGGEEITLGSDLDLLVLGEEKDITVQLNKLNQLKKILSYRTPLGVMYELDFRLRPYGNDGTPIVTVNSLRQYYQEKAIVWERQALTRARFIAGNHRLYQSFEAVLYDYVYTSSVDEKTIHEVEKMCHRITKEKGQVLPPERAFKAGAGGLVAVEFLCQAFQLSFAKQYPSLRCPNTFSVLNALGELKLLSQEKIKCLAKNYRLLRSVQHYLRRDTNRSINELSEDKTQWSILAHWMDFSNENRFWKSYQSAIQENQKIINETFATF